MVANAKNIKKYAELLFCNEGTTVGKTKKLIILCTAPFLFKKGEHSSFAIRTRLEGINDLIKGYGVESMYPDIQDAQYVNMGDTYALTIVHHKGKFRITSWCDLYEKEVLSKAKK